jgi:hypothetical protein
MGYRKTVCKVKGCKTRSAHNTVNPDLCRKHGGGYRCRYTYCNRIALQVKYEKRLCSSHMNRNTSKKCISCSKKNILSPNDIPSCKYHIMYNKRQYNLNFLLYIVNLEIMNM